MGKKNLTKSLKQKETLEQYYQKSQGEWQREDLQAIGRELGLTRQQVYKFLWDKKNCEKKESLKQIQVDPRPKEQATAKHIFEYKSSQLQTPLNLRQAVQFIIDPSVSIWAMNTLKRQGWQLVLQKIEEPSSGYKEYHELSPYHFTKPSTRKRSFQNEMIELNDDQSLFKLNKFEMVPEEMEDHLPFMHQQEHEVKQEFIEEENVCCSNMNPFIQFKYNEKMKKDKISPCPMKFDMIKSDKASSDEIFEPKL